jgi:hypothetical protein
MWRVGSDCVPADDRSGVEQPTQIRRRDSFINLAGAWAAYLSAPRTTAARDQQQRAKCVGADLGLVSDKLIPATRQPSADHFEYHRVPCYDLCQRAAGTGAVKLNLLVS